MFIYQTIYLNAHTNFSSTLTTHFNESVIECFSKHSRRKNVDIQHLLLLAQCFLLKTNYIIQTKFDL